VDKIGKMDKYLPFMTEQTAQHSTHTHTQQARAKPSQAPLQSAVIIHSCFGLSALSIFFFSFP